MKKLLFVLAIGAFAACGESSTEETNTADTTMTTTVDTNTVAAPDTTAPAVADTTAKADSAAKK